MEYISSEVTLQHQIIMKFISQVCCLQKETHWKTFSHISRMTLQQNSIFIFCGFNELIPFTLKSHHSNYLLLLHSSLNFSVKGNCLKWYLIAIIYYLQRNKSFNAILWFTNRDLQKYSDLYAGTYCKIMIYYVLIYQSHVYIWPPFFT